MGGAVGTSGAALALGPGAPELPLGPIPRVTTHKLENQGPRFLPLVPLAALGTAALWLSRDTLRRRGILMALAWAAPALLGLLVLLPSDLHLVPAHRALPVAFGIPLLAAAALVAGVRFLGRIRPAILGWGLAAVCLVGVLGAEMVWARQLWATTPSDQGEIYLQSSTSSSYLAQVRGDAPVVFVTDNARREDPGRLVRTGLSTDQIPRAYVYIGTTGNLVAGRPTLRPGDDTFNDRSRRHWLAVRPLMGRDPIILFLSSLNPGVEELPGTPVTEGVTVIGGPAPRTPVQVAQPNSRSLSGVALTVATALALLTVVGSGWSAALVPGSWLERIALAPALGTAVLILGGLLGGRLGADGPGPRPVLALILTAAGWGAVAVRRRRAGAGEPGWPA
jgi:hypothetical protein